jgi:glycosyltransferase involved in cell wall biosynthesis
MKFTIFSSFYNNIEYLPQVWEGIKTQTYTDWEWIISDDMSTDPQSEQILKDFANSTPKVKYIKPRWKREFYYNPPVEISTGDIMLIQDVDDFPHPKLLEVYKYNYNKFPDVELISCSSMIRNENINGKIEWYKDNHYKGIYNQKEALEKMWRCTGDAISYRIRSKTPNEFVKQGELEYCWFEDMIKSTVLETRGKFLFIPRVLHTYSQLSSTSVSHNTISHEDFYKGNQELKKFIQKNHSGIVYEELDSREHYYDEHYDIWAGMLLSDHYLSPHHFKLDIYNSQLTPRSRNRIKELFFDYDIKYSTFREEADYVFFKVSQEEDLKHIKDNFNYYYEKGKKITICCSNSDLTPQISSIVKEEHWWHEWNGNRTFTFNHIFIIKPKKYELPNKTTNFNYPYK